MLTPIIIFIGVLSSIASDAGYLVLIPLGAAAFKSVGRNPLAGIAAAFAGVAAGFGVNFLITPLDGVLTEITNDAQRTRRPRSLDRPRREPLLRHRLDRPRHVPLTLISARIVEPRPRQARRVAESHGDSLDADKAPRGSARGRGARPRYAALRRPGRARRDHAAHRAPRRAAAGSRHRRHHRRLAVHGQPDRDHHAHSSSSAGWPTVAERGRSGRATTCSRSITKSWAGLASLLFLFLLIAQFIAYFSFSNMAQVAP